MRSPPKGEPKFEVGIIYIKKEVGTKGVGPSSCIACFEECEYVWQSSYAKKTYTDSRMKRHGFWCCKPCYDYYNWLYDMWLEGKDE